MKKFLSIVMVLMMVFAFSASAFAADYTDTDALAQEVKDSIAKVSALAIFEGDGDNTFRPNDTITRAEFAKVACVAAGLGTSGDALKNTASQFTDVQPGEWWTGWINLSVAQGFMKGDPNGTFRPKDPITMAEVTTVLLRMLGYTDNLPGLWPVDYIAQGGKLDLFENVDFKSDAPATRAQVAVMLDNDLDQNIVVWSKDKDAFENKGEKDGVVTLMSESFRGSVAKDVKFTSASLTYKEVTAEGKTSYNIASKNGSIDPMVDAFKYTGVNKDQLELVYAQNEAKAPTKVAEDYAISGGLTLADLAGQTADIIYDKKTDGSTNKVKYIDVTSKVVTTDSIKDVNMPGKYEMAEDTKLGAYVMSDDGTVRISNVKYNVLKDANIPKKMADSKMRIVLDKDDNVIEALFVNDYLDTQANLVDKYNASAKRIELKADTSIKLSGLNYIIFKDGEKVEATELAENDAIYAFKDACGFDYVIYASELKSGKVTAVETGSSDKVVIDGTKYTASPKGFVYSKDSDDYSKTNISGSVIADDMFGETAQFALDRAGRVSVLVFNAEEKASNYVVITSVTASSQGRVTAITVANAEGKYVSYDMDNSDGTVATYDLQGDKDIVEGQLVKITINSDGLVDAIARAVDAGDTSEIDKTNKRILIGSTWYKVPTTVAAYDVTFETDKDLPNLKLVDKVETIAYNDLLSKNDFKGENVQVFVKDGQLKAIAATDYTGSTSAKFGVVKNNAYYTGSDKLVLFYGFGSDDYSYKADGHSTDNKALVSFKTSGNKLSELDALFIPSETAPTVDFSKLNPADGKAQDKVWYYAKGEEKANVAEVSDTELDKLGSEIKSVSNDQIEVSVLVPATGEDPKAEGYVAAHYENAFITLDSDTYVLDYSSYADKLASNTVEKLATGDLTTGMKVIVVTSDDADKTGFEGIAMLVIVVSNN